MLVNVEKMRRMGCFNVYDVDKSALVFVNRRWCLFYGTGCSFPVSRQHRRCSPVCAQHWASFSEGHQSIISAPKARQEATTWQNSQTVRLESAGTETSAVFSRYRRHCRKPYVLIRIHPVGLTNGFLSGIGTDRHGVSPLRCSPKYRDVG